MFLSILRSALLWIPLEAVRDGLKSQSLEFDQWAWSHDLDVQPVDLEDLGHLADDVRDDDGDCKVEAKNLKQLLLELGYTGPLSGDHCNWPGIKCQTRKKGNSCRVRNLECQKCGGHLPEIIEMPSLWEVSLTSPNLTGDIKAFSKMTQLGKLHLHGAEISGGLNALAELVELKDLDLSGTRVTGCLEDLQASQSSLNLGFDVAANLERLHLQGTQVSGDLKALAQNKNLKDLDLSGTRVTGSLEDLPKQGMIERLNLARTEVTGNLSSLQKGTQISFKTFCRYLREVDLSFTRVSGRFTSTWPDACRVLETLQLQNSSVQFVPEEQELMEWKKHRKVTIDNVIHLKTLDLTNCPVNSPLEDLLLPLAMFSLTSIKAAGAGITGAMPKLKNVDVRVDDQNHSGYTFPLAKSLLILDLSRNNVSELRDLPVLPLDGRINLRENQQLVVPPRVLTEAITQQISMDLSDTELTNQEEVADVLVEGAVRTTEMYVYRQDKAGYACKELVGTVKVTPPIFLPQQLCKCLPGWHGRGAACKMCPVDTFSDDMGLDTCKSCIQNSTAAPGSTKLADCKCEFGNLHNGTCACDKHQTLRDGNCTLCSKLRLQCNIAGMNALTAAPEVNHTRLESKAEEARRCLPPDVSKRCPGSHQCGLGYDGTLCATCADGFWAKGGRCEPCAQGSTASVGLLVLVGTAAVLAAALLGYRCMYGQQVPQRTSVKSLLHKLLTLQAPVLLQMVQLWSVLSRLGQRSPSTQGLSEVPYLEALQLTTNELQNSLNLQCTFHAETVRTLSALSSPLAPLLLLGCSAALELCHGGFGVNMALRTLTFLFIGGASSTAELLSCQSEDGDGQSLGDFAFRKAIRHLRCDKTDGVGFWVDAVGYSSASAVAYGALIPLFLAGLMLRQYFVLQEARLLCAFAEGEHRHVSLRLERLQGQIPKEALPKRLLAAAAAHMAVHCSGKRRVQLHDRYITTTSLESEEVKESEELDVIKAVADAETSRKIDLLRRCRLTTMLTERIMLEEARDRWLIGSQPLLYKYTLSQDVWMDVMMKLFAVALVSCVSMSDAWKWAIAFSLGMAVLVGTCQPYMWPQVSQLQSLSCFCLALASLAFVYDCAWLARVALVAPVMLLLWQVRCPDCMEALAERLYQELQSELPKLQRGENHEVLVQQLRF